ncbi:hypothetical protein PR202_ga07253 [Eleusine coracana subsp. coracana]|uniref:F-box domain-containing protein n=1 Tax=Eleusine coracana subsp. coracana TaxID=191504 RepID=A0AAV5BY27_ELECO|nr:hypothetical protein PR202_ga07253 [Eleusine coracana subsp. coracana]
MVLDNDNILGEILLRVALATSLVRAALVCRRWLHIVSHPAFLRRFCDLNSPPLLGLYIQPIYEIPKFALMPDLPDELAAIAHRASSALDGYPPENNVFILSCLNGRLILNLCGPDCRDYYVLLSPLDLGLQMGWGKMAAVASQRPAAGKAESAASPRLAVGKAEAEVEGKGGCGRSRGQRRPAVTGSLLSASW